MLAMQVTNLPIQSKSQSFVQISHTIAPVAFSLYSFLAITLVIGVHYLEYHMHDR